MEIYFRDNWILDVILSIIFIGLFIISFWLISRNKLKNDTIFDISFIILFFSLFFSRLSWIVFHLNLFIDIGWSILPVAKHTDQTLIMQTFPWIFLNIKFGGLEYLGLIFGLIIGLILIYQNSNKQKSLFALFDWLVFSFSFSLIIFLITSAINQFYLGKELVKALIFFHYPGEVFFRFPMQIFQIGVVIIIIVLYFFKKNLGLKKGVWTGLFLFSIGIVEIFLRPQFQDYHAKISIFDFYQIGAIVLILVGIYFIVYASNMRRLNQKGAVNKLENAVPRDFRKPFKRHRGTQNKNDTKPLQKFSMSFANQRTDILNKVRNEDEVTTS